MRTSDVDQHSTPGRHGSSSGSAALRASEKGVLVKRGELATLLILSLLLPVRVASGQNVGADTILGAISDSPPLNLTIDGITVQVFDAARNQLLEQRGAGAYPRLTYYYDVPLTVKASPDGEPLVDGPYDVNGRDVVELTLQPVALDRQRLVRGIREARNAYAREENILPLTIFELKVHVLGAESDSLIAENGIPLAGDIPVQLLTASGSGAALADRLRRGTSLTVGYRTLVKLSQLQEIQATWKQVRATKSYQRYRGPSGPRYITAAQAVHLAADIASELNLFAWMEGDGNEFENLLRDLIRGLVNRRDRRELELESWTDTRQFMIDTADLRAQRDKINQIAIDARDMNSQEWCRKYSSSLNSLAERSSNWSESWGGGLSIVIPAEIPLPIEGDAGASSSGADYAKNLYQQAASSQDCGKNQAASSFSYSWDGEKFIPKSIYVYSTIDGSGQFSDTTTLAAMRIRQRYGTNQKRISTR